MAVSRREEQLLQPSSTYASCNVRTAPDPPSRVVTVAAPHVPSRYRDTTSSHLVADAFIQSELQVRLKNKIQMLHQPDLEAEQLTEIRSSKAQWFISKRSCIMDHRLCV